MGSEIAGRYKIAEDVGRSVCLLKFPCGRTDFEVASVALKPVHRYIRVECVHTLHGCATATVPVLFGGFGVAPKRKTYFTRVFHAERLIVAHAVAEIFYLQPIAETPGEDREGALASGIQFMKIENREELEHRRRNINYLLKVYEREEFVRLGYTARDEDAVGRLRPLSAVAPASPEDTAGEVRRVKKIVFNARVVNRDELLKVARRAEVLAALDEMAEPFRGRFLLKNSFYEKRLQVVRRQILATISRCGRVSFGDARDIPRECAFLLDELCARTAEGYVLRGHCEALGLDDGDFAVIDAGVRIGRLLDERHMASADDIAAQTGLPPEEVADALHQGSFVRLRNGCYASSPGGLKTLILEIFSRKASARAGEIAKAVREGLGAPAPAEDVLAVLGAFCTRKGVSWALKPGD